MKNLLQKHPDGLGKQMTVTPGIHSLGKHEIREFIENGDIPFYLYDHTPGNPHDGYIVILDSDIVGTMDNVGVAAMAHRISELSFYTDQMFDYLGIQKEDSALLYTGIEE